MNPGGGGCSEPRLRHCTPAWRQSKTPSQKQKQRDYLFLQTLSWCLAQRSSKKCLINQSFSNLTAFESIRQNWFKDFSNLSKLKRTSKQSVIRNRPGTLAHAYHPNTLGGQGGRTARGKEFETGMANMVKLCLY